MNSSKIADCAAVSIAAQVARLDIARALTRDPDRKLAAPSSCNETVSLAVAYIPQKHPPSPSSQSPSAHPLQTHFLHQRIRQRRRSNRQSGILLSSTPLTASLSLASPHADTGEKLGTVLARSMYPQRDPP